MKTGKSVRNETVRENVAQHGEEGSCLAVGLSLGTLFGILMNEIALGMMFGVVFGLCAGPVLRVLKEKKRKIERKTGKIDNGRRGHARLFRLQFLCRYPSETEDTANRFSFSEEERKRRIVWRTNARCGGKSIKRREE